MPPSEEPPAPPSKSTGQPRFGTNPSGALTPTLDERPAPAIPAEAPPIPGYEILGLLGRGGMGAVYQARHLRLNKVVAIKLLPPGWGDDSQAVARFHREIDALGALSHPNVVGATDAGEANGLPFLVMEYVEGATLANVVRRAGPLTVADACEAIRQAAVGLQYIHEHGRVHRDLKPSNLMLAADGTVKILDLGLALLGCHAAGQELTPSCQPMGTPDYMAPEQWEDSRRVDIRADLYSLGCALYKLLTGEPPFAGPEYDSGYKKMGAHVHAPVPSLRGRRADVPPGLEAVVRRLLAKSPADRYAAPVELAEALLPFSAGCDLRRLGRACLRPEAPAGGPPATPAGAEDASAGVPTVSRATARRWPRLLPAVLAVVALAAAAAWLLFRPQAPPVRPGPPDGSPAILAPGVWHDVLGRRPVALVWPKKVRNSEWSWDEQTHELKVMCDRDGLLRLGEAAADDYTVEMDLYQTTWGGVGLFFGLGPDVAPNEGGTRYQVVELAAETPGGKGNALSLMWTIIHLAPGGGQRSEQVAVVPLGLLQPRDHKLGLTVTGGLLREVRLDGNKIPGLWVAAAAGGRRPPAGAAYRGAFGVGVLRTHCIVRNARYRFEGAP